MILVKAEFREYQYADALKALDDAWYYMEDGVDPAMPGINEVIDAVRDCYEQILRKLEREYPNSKLLDKYGVIWGEIIMKRLAKIVCNKIPDRYKLDYDSINYRILDICNTHGLPQDTFIVTSMDYDLYQKVSINSGVVKNMDIYQIKNLSMALSEIARILEVYRDNYDKW